MKLRNNWKTINKQWDKIMIRFRISAVDLINIEIDKSRNFYLITIFNITYLFTLLLTFFNYIFYTFKSFCKNSTFLADVF